ncbi:hypothetical protein AB0J83_41490 [Actinoplanes sp. NPDC049596]|uniref:hypothetical protein n=1 Tax=unclassified Actinoplanes TaxID=2626549 RepID=UPI0034341D36
MPVRKGPMAASLSKSWQTVAFQEQHQWGYRLAMSYAMAIDRAERVKQELLDAIEQLEDEGGTANVKWTQRIERLEKYYIADSVVATVGPRLLEQMLKFGMTPALTRPAVTQTETQKGGKSDDSGSTTQATEEPEDELAKLRAERGKHTRAG